MRCRWSRPTRQERYLLPWLRLQLRLDIWADWKRVQETGSLRGNKKDQKQYQLESNVAICPSCWNCCQVFDPPHLFKLSCKSSQWVSGALNRWGRGWLLLYCMTQLRCIAMTAIWRNWAGGGNSNLTTFLLLPDLSLRKPLTATIKREHPPAVISLCRTDHNKVPISNHHVDIILNHNLCFSDDASTGRKSIHKQHYWAISHDVNRWHISQNNFVFSDAGGGEGSRVRGQRDCH